MTHGHRRRIGRLALAGTAVAALAVGLTGCAGGADAGSDLTPEAIDQALEEGGELTYWGWSPSAADQIAAFEDAYPNVTVNFTDTGGGGDHNLKLQNAVTAGSGAPDVTQLEYHILPQFVLDESLVDLTAAGFGELESEFTPSTWSNVALYDGVWGLPQDAGPMALFYNQAVYDEYGLEVPTTWEEFAEEAKTLNDADDSKHLLGDFGEPSFSLAMIRQAGGKPFTVDETDITIDLEDGGAETWTEAWDPMLEDGLLDTRTATWSDAWFQALGDGSIASLVSGAWMAGVLENSVPDGAGDWRVAPMPTFGDSDMTSEMGGSTHAVVNQGSNQALAAGFVRWLSADADSVDIFTGSGGFPSTVDQLEAPEFLGAESEYFGGQQINEVLLESAERVNTDWQFLPWQSYASSIFSDTVGQRYLNGEDILPCLLEWQDANISYGEEQGYTVNGG